MPTDLARIRRAAAVGVGALALFATLVVVAGLAQPNYRPGRDFVSALASEGARFPLLGIVALLSFGVAYLCAGLVLDRWFGSRLGGILLVGAGLLTWVVALARIHCPDGAAFCGLAEAGAGASGVLVSADPSASSLGPHVHGWAVAGSYLLVALAMLWLAVVLWRRGDRRRAAASAAALVASLATVPFWVAADSPGAGQRVWLGILSAWVLLVCATPLSGGGTEA